MWTRRLLTAMVALVGGALLSSCAPSDETGPVVLAAASMQEGLTAAADAWAEQGNSRPVLSFASSAVVARQASEGAPADLVITSDRQWMDWLDERDGLSSPARPLVTNGLVVVAPLDSDGPASLAALAVDPSGGMLAIGEPDSVPAGQFARAALQGMGLWEALGPRIVPGENVRASLALVERGEVPLGVVYASDAQATRQVRVVERIEPEMHPPITYYLALSANARHDDAVRFADFLTSQQGRAIIAAYGFGWP